MNINGTTTVFGVIGDPVDHTLSPYMQNVVDAVNEAGIRDKVKIMVGGAPLTQAFADQLGADGYASDASAAARMARELATA